MSDDRALVGREPEPEPLLVAHVPPLTASYNNRIRPLLDAVDKLRNLEVMKEGIPLPTLDLPVLESLAGISLPRGDGICTRVPLIMRLQGRRPADSPELHLEFNGKIVKVDDEDHVSAAIVSATDEIAGSSKGISNAPLTLVVKKDGVPDLTMIDLPGITRVPVHGQPENISEQILAMIMEYIRPEESIILNVVSATIDFPVCESIRMSQMVDQTGKRTLVVVTKADKAPEGLLEKVTANDVNIGLGYVCIRNRIGDESYEEARLEEAKLFETHPLLCKIDKSIVDVPVLAQKLTQIQATIMAQCLPEIVRSIDDKLNAKVAELESIPKKLSSVEEAVMAFVQIMGSAKESLRKVLLGSEFDEYPDDKDMHCATRLVEMLNHYADELRTESKRWSNFLFNEIEVLKEAKGIGLPDFLTRTAFLTLLQRKVEGILSKQPSLGVRVWDYIETVNYPQLQSLTRRAASNLIRKMKGKTINKMMKILEMEKLTDYTCNPEYLLQRNMLMTQEGRFMEAIHLGYANEVVLQGIGTVHLVELREQKQLVWEAFDLSVRMTVYWKIVVSRFVDSMALHLRFSVHNLVNKEMEKEIGGELIGPNDSGRINRMLEEVPEVAAKREELNRSVELLRESAEVVAKIMDRIATNGNYNN
ncbi:hypothetical protein ACJRO7_010864 [Eucalyptus globulus]|uniref:Uncharacterized protein n=1 Tax=Eucalyptus globulus TaxID=34317 RepID=A0ABD3LDB8_EUCGL